MADVKEPIASFTALSRLNYCHGQMLTAQDFVDEQTYFLSKSAVLVRCTSGHGVACGLKVDLTSEKKADSLVHTLIVEPGIAIDQLGRELVKHKKTSCDLSNSELWETDAEKQDFLDALKDGREGDLYVVIKYRKIAGDERDTPTSDCCTSRKFNTRWSEVPLIRVIFDDDNSTNEYLSAEQSCCSCCQPKLLSDGKELDDRVWLARIHVPSDPEAQLSSADNGIRRPLSKYDPTTIQSVNWMHSGSYDESVAECMLRSGLKLKFTAPLEPFGIRRHDLPIGYHEQTRKQELLNDIVEVTHSKFGGEPEHLACSLELSTDLTSLTCRVVGESRKDLGLGPNRRVSIRLKSDFILDRCCKPVDGNNLGGRVSHTEWEQAEFEQAAAEFGGKTPPSYENYIQSIKQFDGRLNSLRTELKLKADPCEQNLLMRDTPTGDQKAGGDFCSWFYIE